MSPRALGYSFAASVPITVGVYLSSVLWHRHVLAHPELIDQVTLWSRTVRCIEDLYLPAFALMIGLSPNAHQPSEIIGALALLAQTLVMVLLVVWAGDGAWRAIRRRRSLD